MTMKNTTAILASIAAAACFSPGVAAAQDAPTAIVSIYHAAPGQQVALLKWLARQDQIAAAAGTPAAQLYVHQDGADWDYVLIQPGTTDAQDAAFEAAAKKLGVDVGPRSGIEFRKHIISHSDTIARGPTTAAAYLSAIGER
jgi:membrane-bound lytic murein transglycosylase B